MDSDIGCSGCCVQLESESDIASTDFAPDDRNHENGARYWCADCFLAHQDGHPGNPYMQQHCSPERCPTYNGVWRT